MDYSGKIITKNAVEPSQTSAPGVWTLDQAAQAVESNTWPIANVPNPISRSLRFDSAATAYLNRTVGSGGSTTTWTISLWFKRSKLGANQMLWSAYYSGNVFYAEIPSTDLLRIRGSTIEYETSQKFRDPSAWYHLVFSWDSTNATAGNRMRVYLNGIEINNWSTETNAGSSENGYWNQSGATINIGRYANYATEYYDGYMAQFQFIDGQALTPSSFGMTDPRTGAWISKPYTGTYGTTGFYLNFSDNSTTAALGTDYSGNLNTWTTNNFSVTAGSGNDSMVDVPTNWVAYNTGDVGGVVRGNYATLNPLFVNGSYPITYSNGNLDATRASGGQGGITSTIGMSAGKWYWEVVFSTYAYNIGITTNPAGSLTGSEGVAGYNGGGGTSIGLQPSGVLRTNGTAGSTYTSWTTGDVMGIALDMDNGNLYYYKNGTVMNSGSPVATSLTGSTWFFITSLESGGSLVSNFGQRPFAYTPPAGFKSLCTTNLPEPTVLDGGDYFNAVLWNGASSGTSINVTGFGFQPDLIWTKSRNNSYDHYLQDAVRGIGVGNENTLSSNTTGSEANTSGLATSFLSDGFNISSSAGSTSAGNTEVTWGWKANGAGVTNSQGTITATVSANTTAGFSIVTGTTLASGTLSYGHGLGVTPAMVIYKSRDTAGQNWWVWHQSLPNAATGRAVKLNSLDGEVNGAYFGTPSVSDTVVTVAGAALNSDGFVSYVFAAVPGFSAFGSYNGVNTGKLFVYTGFRPAYVLLKKITSSSVTYGWPILDKVRPSPSGATEGYNPTLELWADSSTNELSSSSNYNIDLLSNGFCINDPANSNVNSSGNTYIYAAFASNPFKYSNAR